MTKRLSSVNVESTAQNRLRFRETLFSAQGMKNYIGGVILYDETIKQKTSSGKTIPELIKSFGAIPGIKVDTGAKKLAGSPEEKVTEGLDGLRERLIEYFKIDVKDVFVFHDDMDIDLGKVKVKFGGSSAGHNGIESIDKNIGKNYSRIRIGIGRPKKDSTGSDHDLENFSNEEVDNVQAVTKNIIESLSILINKDLDLFSSKVNQKY